MRVPVQEFPVGLDGDDQADHPTHGARAALQRPKKRGGSTLRSRAAVLA